MAQPHRAACDARHTFTPGATRGKGPCSRVQDQYQSVDLGITTGDVLITGTAY